MIKRFLHITLIMAAPFLLFPHVGTAGVPLPEINQPEGEGVECVEDEEVMIRDHMNFILHQRDETMHRGIRTSKYSFAECIDCHVQPDEQGNIASIDSNEHFCKTCHEYSAVTIDCFDCHADRPQEFIERQKPSDHPPVSLQQELHQLLPATEPTAGDSK